MGTRVYLEQALTQRVREGISHSCTVVTSVLLAAAIPSLVNLLVMAMTLSMRSEKETWGGGLPFTPVLWLDWLLNVWCG